MKTFGSVMRSRPEFMRFLHRHIALLEDAVGCSYEVRQTPPGTEARPGSEVTREIAWDGAVWIDDRSDIK